MALETMARAVDEAAACLQADEMIGMDMAQEVCKSCPCGTTFSELVDSDVGKLVHRAVECRHCEVAVCMTAAWACGDVLVSSLDFTWCPHLFTTYISQ